MANGYPEELVRIRMEVTHAFGEFAESKINRG